jgi:alpha-tubulin suppressor-like RCC1 family protein
VSPRGWYGAALAGAAALGVAACKATVEPLALAGPPAAAAVSTGNNQSGAIGTRLADSLVVAVTDAAGNPVPGVIVNWVASAGTLTQLVDTTDGTGKSGVQWTLGTVAGTATVTATPEGLTPVTFTATASPVSGTLVFRYVDAGSYHACGITTDERAICWGFNGDGQLMADSSAQTLQPTPAAGNLTFRVTSGGRYHSCGVTLSGVIYCAGANQDGRLLNKSQTPSPLPSQVHSPITFQLVSAGGAHTCAISLTQDVWCGGNNAEGELGDTTTFTHADTLRPISTIGTLRYRTVSAGGLHSCALTTGGVAQCWGYNLSGQLGAATAQLRNFFPVNVSGGITFQVDPTFIPHAPDPDFYVPAQGFLSAGYAHTCGVAVGGTIFCWGNNDDGQLGRAGASSSAPSAVGGGLLWKAVSSGVRHTCALTTAGLGYCWGNNDFGQLGNGSRGASTTPVAVSLSLVFQSISAGETFSCGVTTAGVAYCWGDNEFGQLGVRSTSGSLTPVKVAFQP